MTLPAPTYDLVLLLDADRSRETLASGENPRSDRSGETLASGSHPQSGQQEPASEKILRDVRAMIASQGELLRDDDWGDRALTYPIDHKATAKYHLLQFHAGSPELLSGLDRTLRIADEVVRFRIVKLKPGTPDAPDMRAPGASAATVSAPTPEPVVAAVEPG
jgi:small subunit ribosomal protein S6